MTTIEALLNISSPQFITYCNTDNELQNKMQRHDLDQLDRYTDDATKPANLFTMLNNHMGLYGEVKKEIMFDTKGLKKTCMVIPEIGEIELFLQEPLSFPDDVLWEGNLSICKYIYQILTQSNNILPRIHTINLGDLETWYQRAFDFVLFEEGVQGEKPWGMIQKIDALLCIYEQPDLVLLDRFESAKKTIYYLGQFGLRIDNRKKWGKTIIRENIDILCEGLVRWPKSLAWYIKDSTGWEIEVALSDYNKIQFEQ